MKKYTLKNNRLYIDGILEQNGGVSIQYAKGEPKVFYSLDEAKQILSVLNDGPGSPFENCKIIPVNIVKK